MDEKELVKELCEGCFGCSTTPESVSSLCSNPLSKYLYRKSSLMQTESYFRGREDGVIISSHQTALSKEGLHTIPIISIAHQCQ